MKTIKKIIIKTISFILPIAIFSTFVGCQKNLSTPTESDSTTILAETETSGEFIPEKDKNIKHYEDFLLSSEEKIQYNGTYKLGKYEFSSQDKFSTIAKNFMLLEFFKTQKLNARTETTVETEHWPSGTYLSVFNPNNKDTSYYDCDITGVNIPVTRETKLYDIIGEQPLGIPEQYNFIESLFFAFGQPDNLTTTGNNIEAIFNFNTVLDDETTISGHIKLDFNDTNNTGNLLITFE